MAGARYHDWAHVHVVGDDRAAAAPYVLEARKLLGYVVEDAAHNKLQTHQVTRRYEDGAVVVAEIRGGIPRMTIVPPPPNKRGVELPPPDDFVVWARDDDHPDGIDAEHPQQILKTAWNTFFFSAQVDGYKAFQRSKGTYSVTLPKGVSRAGNLDWCGPKRERIQWHGPSTRYWYEPFVQMVAQYGTKVFMTGQVVLDTEAYIAASQQAPDPQPSFVEQYVLGAGIRGLWLYVVQVQAQNLSVPVPNPSETGSPGSPYYLFSPCYTPYGVDTVVCRYRLIPHPDGSPGYRVAPKSREVLWSGAVLRGINPWFFNPDCTEAITFIPPAVQAYGSTAFVPDFDTSTTQKVLTLDHDGIAPEVTITDTQVSLAPGESEAPIAADYDRDGNRVEIRIRRRDLGLPTDSIGLLSQRFDLVCGGAAVELRDLQREGGTENHWDTRRWIMWADAREGVLVCRRQSTHFRDPPGSGVAIPSTQVWLEVWSGGALVLSRTDGRTDVSEENNSFGTWLSFNTNQGDHQSDNLHQELAPMLPLYGWCWGHNNLMTPHQITGAHAGFCYLPRQPAHVFGWTLIGRLDPAGADIPSTRSIYAEVVNAPPEAEKLDEDGMDSVLGCAASEGVILLSAYPKAAGLKSADHVAIGGNGAQLPELTGVTGPRERYHPIWLLGRPPPPTPT